MELKIIISDEQLAKIIDERLRLAFEQYGQNNNEAAPPARRSMTVDEVSAYTGLCKQSVYKKTSLNEIPHAKRGKRLFFDRAEIDSWLLENRRITNAEAEKQADQYLRTNAARRAR